MKLFVVAWLLGALSSLSFVVQVLFVTIDSLSAHMFVFTGGWAWLGFTIAGFGLTFAVIALSFLIFSLDA
jgi:hypothetical protein